MWLGKLEPGAEMPANHLWGASRKAADDMPMLCFLQSITIPYQRMIIM